MDPKRVAEHMARAVLARIGTSSPEIERVIAEEINTLLREPMDPRGQVAADNATSQGIAASHVPQQVAGDIAGFLQDRGGEAAAPGVVEHTSGPAAVSEAAARGGATERVVISANGRNGAGIVARLTGVITEYQGDIRDISQTIIGEYFTMLIVVDITGATHRGTSFAEFKDRLEGAGRSLGVHVVALHEDLLSAMHSV